MKRFGAVAFAGLVLAAGCGGDESDDASSTTPRPTTTADTTATAAPTTATPTTPKEAAALVRSASDRLARVGVVAQSRQCERKAEVQAVRDKTVADGRALTSFARQDGRPQIRRLMRVSTEALAKGIVAVDSFLATCP